MRRKGIFREMLLPSGILLFSFLRACLNFVQSDFDGKKLKSGWIKLFQRENSGKLYDLNKFFYFIISS